MWKYLFIHNLPKCLDEWEVCQYNVHVQKFKIQTWSSVNDISIYMHQNAIKVP